MTDTPTYIGQQVEGIMALVADIDRNQPEEDIVEVLIGSVGTWGVVEAQVLFPALEAAFDDADTVIAAARRRLHVLYELQGMIHEDETSDEPWASLVRKYVDAVKYHVLVDVQDIAPLAAQLPPRLSAELSASMSAMKLDLE